VRGLSKLNHLGVSDDFINTLCDEDFKALYKNHPNLDFFKYSEIVKGKKHLLY
jgi:hypothetical protein